MFEQKRLGDNGTRAARSEEFDDRGDEMNKQHDQVAHRAIVAISTSVTRLGYPQDLCDKSEIRHTQVRSGRAVRSAPEKLLPGLQLTGAATGSPSY